jgi:tryptophan-rich sensory protein
MKKNLFALASFAAVTALTSLLGARSVRRAPRKAWYRAVRKPKQTPPDWVFGAVWPVLYGLSALSAYRTWQRRDVPGAKSALALWGTQQAFNAAWTPLFFGQRRAKAALVDLGLTVASLAAYVARTARIDRTAAVLMAPYLAWLGFASTLNAGVIRKNPSWLVM